MKIIVKELFFSSIFLLIGCNNSGNTKQIKAEEIITIITPAIYYNLIKTHPHDTTSFTEGLVIHNKALFESTGSPDDLINTKSVFGPIDLSTGKIEVKSELDRAIYFGEGIAFLNNKIYQLTYQNQVGFIYDTKSFKRIGQFNFKSKEGWGLTTDGTFLIMSDGTHVLTFLDPISFNVVKTLNVTENDVAVTFVNELEFIKGYIYANIFTTNYIIKIDPQNGNVVGKMDLKSLSDEARNIYPGSREMNGIAYDSVGSKIYVTGKMWPYIYEIKFPL